MLEIGGTVRWCMLYRLLAGGPARETWRLNAF